MLDSVVRVNKKYYPQTLLEEFKYEPKKNKMENLVNDDLDPQVHQIMMNLMINLLKIKTVF